jgi:hypothetical protein
MAAFYISHYKPAKIEIFHIFLVVLFILGIVIPWETSSSIEIRNNFIMAAASGGLSFGALTILLFSWLIKALIGKSKARIFKIILLVPGIFVSLFCLWISTTFKPDIWQDKGIYQNKDEYIIVQFNAFGLLGEHTEWRLIKTKNPDLPIRRISIIKTKRLRDQLSLPEFGSDYIKAISALRWNSKIWKLKRFD